jgi:hypothetical protein
MREMSVVSEQGILTGKAFSATVGSLAFVLGCQVPVFLES